MLHRTDERLALHQTDARLVLHRTDERLALHQTDERLVLHRTDERLALRLRPRSASLSGERPLLELEALLDLLDRRAGPTVFIFDVGRDRPAFFFEELQDLADRGGALTPRRVARLMLFSI